MSAQHTPGPKQLTQREQRTLDRLQIKWSKKTITAEEKVHALALSNRAWLAMKAAETEDGAAIAKATGGASLAASDSEPERSTESTKATP